MIVLCPNMENDALLCLVELCYYGEEIFQINVNNIKLNLEYFLFTNVLHYSYCLGYHIMFLSGEFNLYKIHFTFFFLNFKQTKINGTCCVVLDHFHCTLKLLCRH